MWLARIVIGISCCAVASAVAGQVWNEAGDARSFPDAAAQVTRGAGELTTIVGATSGSDLRDAFCIKIVDPASFRVTTDPGTAPGAGASFDTRLFLFDEYGAPVLANDDASSSGAAFVSALSGTATDGSSVALSRPGEYVLLVSGSLASPRDSTGRHLFAIGAGRGLTHAPDPLAGRFDRWEADRRESDRWESDRRESGAAATGSYSAVLAGATFCQGAPDDALDVVLGSAGAPERVCLGDGSGGFQACADVGVDVAGAADIEAGFVDGDAHLDVVFSGGSFGGGGAPNVLCLGNGAGGFSGCQEVSPDDAHTRGVALGFVDGDSNLDAVFANDVFGGQANNRVCLGDGSGGFTSCADVSDDGDRTAAVALGLLDGDANLDAVFANSGPQGQLNRVCLGNGDGTFQPCADVSADVQLSIDVALGLLDGDSHLDVIFANVSQFSDGEVDRVCLGNGDGTFGSCADVPTVGTPKDSTGVALGLLNEDSFLDALFTSTDNARSRVCLGDGGGSFTPCTNMTEPLGYSTDVALGLVDEDGNLDAVITNWSNSRNGVCLGNGDGTFQPCEEVGSDEDGASSVVLGEFGDPDIFADGFESGDTSAWAVTVP